ncbi:hypothetical protein SDC9_88431 [bioreactor metagenome]|uniref:Uncharacterized protein n=1 Tax=bioreactor metagenome TaxID=1076179 RepID=A0A644ZLK3_9ZZZZ
MIEGFLGEIFTVMFLNNNLEFFDHAFQVFSGHIGIGLVAFILFETIENFFECFIGKTENNGAEHLDQASVGIENEALIVGQFDHTLGSGIVQTNVEDGVHHARH